MTDMGRRTGTGDMLKSVYDPNQDGVIAIAQTEADMKASVYQPQLAAVQALLADHHAQHEDGGTDEIDATGLTGVPVAPLLLDGVAGRVLRFNTFYIDDGTNLLTLKCTAYNLWNGNAKAAVDNIPKGGSQDVYSLNAGGSQLTIDASAFTGNIKAAMIDIYRSSAQTLPTIYAVRSGNNMVLHFYATATGFSMDMAGEIGTGQVRCILAYITDA